MEKSLKEKKEELKKAWEECFEMKIEDKLNNKGLEHFWSDATTVNEAEELLTGAAIGMVLDSIIESVLGFDKDEPCNVNNGKPYRVARVEDGKITFIEDDEFETEDAAKAEIQERVSHSTHTLSDFCVIQVQVCK